VVKVIGDIKGFRNPTIQELRDSGIEEYEYSEIRSTECLQSLNY